MAYGIEKYFPMEVEEELVAPIKSVKVIPYIPKKPKCSYRVYVSNYRKADYIIPTMKDVGTLLTELSEKVGRNTFTVKEYSGKQLVWRYLVSVMPEGVEWSVIIED